MSKDSDRVMRLVATVVVGAAVAAVLFLGVVSGAPPDRESRGWADVYDEVAPSVLLVALDDPEPRVGTAFAVSATEAITARHLVIGAPTVRLTDPLGQSWDAVVVGTDARTDLALLRIEGTLPPATLGSSEGLRVGDPVVAIGNPFGLGHSLSTGVVAHRGRRLEAGADGPRVDFLQLSIPLNPGNSGGPVFDGEGRVVGVLAGTHTQGQGIAFAVPVEAAVAGLQALRQGEHISRAFLGLRAVEVSGALLVESVAPSGPADRAGVRPGDALTAVDGITVETPDGLAALLDRLPGGKPISVRLLRDGKLQIADLVLGDWAEQPVVVAGMTLRADPGSGGVVVAVRPRSRAERAGILVADVIQRVNGLPMRAPVDVREALPSGDRATIEIVRDGISILAHLE